MSVNEKKGITVKVDAELHAEVRQYLERHNVTMAEFVALALEDELHPKFRMKEEKSMGNMRNIAFQVSEDLFQRLKDYLLRNNMTQKEFIIGLIEDELERDLTESEETDQNQELVKDLDEEQAYDMREEEESCSEEEGTAFSMGM